MTGLHLHQRRPGFAAQVDGKRATRGKDTARRQVVEVRERARDVRQPAGGRVVSKRGAQLMRLTV